MDGPARTVVLVTILAALAFLGLNARPGASAAADRRIAVLTSHDTVPYQEVLAGFRQYLSQYGKAVSSEVYPLQGDAAKAPQLLQQAKQGGASLLFTLGALATQAAIRECLEIPLLASMVLNIEKCKLVPNATGVVLEFPLAIQLQWLQRFLPQKKTVGVLFNPKENGDKIETATKLASDLGLRLIARAVETPQDLPDALENLARQIDVLWGIADQTVLSPQTAEAILLTAFRHRIPFVGLSMSWVKAGALYALDRDYLDLGAQCGEMALQLLQGAQASALPPIAPRKVVYSLNLKTASYMKVDIPEALIKGAQQVFP